MKLKVPSFASALGLFAGLLAAPGASAQELHIYTAIEVEFATEKGKSYSLQGSPDLVTWNEIGDAVFGNGATVDKVFSTRSITNVTYQTYRLKVTENTTPGLAPWSFNGLSIALRDDAASEHYDFQTETNGVKVSPSGSTPFSYTLSRSGVNDVTVEMVRGSGAYYADRKEIFTFSFASAITGTFVREEYRAAKLKSRDLGPFSLIGTNGTGLPPATVIVEPPVSLAGLAFNFQTGELPERLDFISATAGFAAEDKVKAGEDEPSKPFTYSYTLTNPTNATLVVNLPQNRRDEYALVFTREAQGSFVRREFVSDVLQDTDTGAFAPGGTATNNPASVVFDGPLPTALSGLSFQFRDGESSNKLSFSTVTTGVDFADSDTSSFTYTYTASSPSSASIVVQFKADKWDEYTLNLDPSGVATYVRREFRKGVLNDTDSGPFMLVQ